MSMTAGNRFEICRHAASGRTVSARMQSTTTMTITMTTSGMRGQVGVD